MNTGSVIFWMKHVIAALLAGALTAGCLFAQTDDAVALQAAIKRVRPALIRIRVVEAYYRDGREVKSESSGSGVIISEDGYAVTNHHVAGDAKRLVVNLSDKEELGATLVGTDPLSDIAVIKLNGNPGRKYPKADFGDSSVMRVGDKILAMGSPASLSQSVTHGIISNIEMIMPELSWPFNHLTLAGEDVGSMVRWLGHDARIAGGNSGGPLINMRGEIIGINEISLGLSGAIPGNLVKTIAQQIISKSKVIRSWLGIDVQPLLKSSPVKDGALVGGVIGGSPAEKAGLRSGDIILKLNGSPVSVRFGEDVPLFNQMVGELPVGIPVELIVLREGKQQTIKPVTQEREQVLPREREFKAWGITARNISLFMAKEYKRDTQDGAMVTSVASGGPANDAKPPLREDDIIVRLQGKPVKSVEDLEAVTKMVLAGNKDRVPSLVEFDRGTERYLTVVRLGHDPLRDPGLEASKAWVAAGTQVLTEELAKTLNIPGKTGVRVTEVYANHSAAKAGLRVGDIIVALDGDIVEASQPQDVEVFPEMVRQKTIGDMVELTVLRDGKPLKIKLSLEASPKISREMKRYRSDDFEFTARNVTFSDKDRRPEAKPVFGVVIESVDEGGWAAVARLAVGDILTEVDGTPVKTVSDLETRMDAVKKAKSANVVFHVRRGIREMFVEVQPNWSDR